MNIAQNKGANIIMLSLIRSTTNRVWTVSELLCCCLFQVESPRKLQEEINQRYNNGFGQDFLKDLIRNETHENEHNMTMNIEYNACFVCSVFHRLFLVGDSLYCIFNEFLHLNFNGILPSLSDDWCAV